MSHWTTPLVTLNEQVFQSLVETWADKDTIANIVVKFGWEVDESEHVLDVGMCY